MSTSTYAERLALRAAHLASNDTFVLKIPKIELHVHIEGTMSPSLRWELSQRNNISLTVGSSKLPLHSLQEVKDAYTQIRGRIGASSAHGETHMTFFEAYYGGFALLQTEEDYYDLAISYFERAAEMNVRYCEPFFDLQGHMRRGIPVSIIMAGFRRAQLESKERWKLKSNWIMCILRDMTLESAKEAYDAVLPYKDMIVGIGLDSDELDNPPSKFKEVFRRARNDGFKLTAHCDFNAKNTHEHLRQALQDIGGDGVDRIDHGMNAADLPELILMSKTKGENFGLTICPCAYIRHTDGDEVFGRIRRLLDAGVKMSIGSDDPAYMEDSWVANNLLMLRDKCNFSNEEMVRLQRDAVAMCWAGSDIKEGLFREIDEFGKSFKVTSNKSGSGNDEA